MSRSKTPSVYRQADNQIDEDHFLSALQKNLKKDAVQSRSVDESMFDQINAIMNVKSKYPSVQAAVEDMRERSGLTNFLKNKLSEDSSEEVTIKTAQEATDDETPEVIKKVPSIQQTMENYIKSTLGSLPIPAVVYKLKSIHKNDVADPRDWDDGKLLKLISKLSLEEKQKNPEVFNRYENLGRTEAISDSDIDVDNTDAFIGLNPAKNS